MTALIEEKVQALKGKIWGEVLRPTDGAAFKDACYTASIPRVKKEPAIVVRPRGTADVVEAVKFSSAEGLGVAVKAGGHSAPNYGLIDGGLTIDMSLMRSCTVDPYKKIAVAAGGCLLGDIDRETAVYDLVAPLGHAPVTGMGLTLGGGVGIGTRIFGPTCSHVIGATLVKSDGTVVVCDEEHDPELLWALKGAGASLGVVTSVTYRLNDIPPDKTYTGLMLWPDDPEHNNWRTIARWMTDVAYDEPGFSCNLVRAFGPDGSPMLASMMVYVSDKSRAEKEAFLAPMRALGPIADHWGQMRYVDTQFSVLPMIKGMPPHSEYWTSGQLKREQVTDQMLDAFISVTLNSLTAKDHPCSLILFDLWGGKHAGCTGPNALGKPDGEIGWMTMLGWMDPKLDSATMDLASKIKSTMAAYGSGSVYVNMTSGDTKEDAHLAARVGGEANLARLRAVKRRVDPCNMFKSHPLQGL